MMVKQPGKRPEAFFEEEEKREKSA